MSKSVEFTALIKKIEVKSLVSLDRGARMVIDFDGNDNALLAKLIKKHKADDTVKVIIE